MRRTAIALSVATAMMFVVSLSAQKTSFAGKWTIDQEKTTAANPAPAAGGGGGRGGAGGGGGMGGGAGAALEITQTDKTIVIGTNTYNLDGTESKNMQPGRQGAEPTPVMSTAKWDGAKLVITTKGANGDTVAAYSMDGAELLRESTRPGRQGGAATTTKTYYKKG